MLSVSVILFAAMEICVDYECPPLMISALSFMPGVIGVVSIFGDASGLVTVKAITIWFFASIARVALMGETMMDTMITVIIGIVFLIAGHIQSSYWQRWYSATSAAPPRLLMRRDNPVKSSQIRWMPADWMSLFF